MMHNRSAVAVACSVPYALLWGSRVLISAFLQLLILSLLLLLPTAFSSRCAIYIT